MSPRLEPLDDFLSRFMRHGEAHEGWSRYHVLDGRVSLRRLQAWMKQEGVAYSELNWQKLQGLHRFLTAEGLSTHSCLRAINHSQRALRWGVEQGELPQKLTDIYPFHFQRHSWDIELPVVAHDFLSRLEATLSPQSVRLHGYGLRVFHTYLRDKKLTYRKFRQEHGVGYVKYLHAKNFYPRGKAQLAMRARIYLKWLYEQGEITRHPDELLPSRTVPRVPAHTPRPLDPELDLKLQALLRETDDLLYKSILLLRHTGMRVGELRALPFHCMEGLKPGPISLRVPAIKLGIERLLPLDTPTVSLIEDIQRRSLQNAGNQEPEYLVILRNRQRPNYDRIREVMTEVCSRLNTKQWINMHALRHTYATSLLNAGLSITTLKELLGHKTIIMTLGYAKLAQVKVSEEYHRALEQMNTEYIPRLLEPKSADDDVAAVEDAFKRLAAVMRRQLDQWSHEPSDDHHRQHLNALSNRLSKLKTESLRWVRSKDQS